MYYLWYHLGILHSLTFLHQELVTILWVAMQVCEVWNEFLCMGTHLGDSMKHNYTVCMVSALASTLYSYNQPFCIRPSTYATLLSVVTTDVLPLCHLIGQSVNSVSTLPQFNICLHLFTSVTQTDRCCHHALCPQESEYCRQLFMQTHFEPSYQYPVLTIPNTMPFMHTLHCTQSGHDIQMHMVPCTPHINFLFRMTWNFAHWITEE
jgi:hypothetical protein